jgi:hypothetical protein
MTLPPGSPPPDPFHTPASHFPAAPAYAPPAPAYFKRPGVVSFLAVLDILAGLLYLAGGTLIGVLALAGQIEGAAPLFVILGGFAVVLGALYLATGLGLWILKPFGRTCQFVVSVLWLLSIPIGTIIGAMTMYYLTRPGVALLFSGRAPAALSPEQRASVDRDARGGALLVALFVCIGFGALATVGIIAAIAIPGLLAGRMVGNEVSAIGRLRAMSSGQVVYSIHHGGQYGTLDCLLQPALCPPVEGEPTTTPYISPDMGQSPRNGYTFRLSVADDQTGFTYYAEPETRGRSGNRAFCLDHTGTIVEYTDGVPAPPGPGEPCPDGGEPLM